MTSIHLAVASTTSLPGCVERNLKQIDEFARRAGADGVDLLLTAEMSASGYGGFPEVLTVAERAGEGPIYMGLARSARESGVVVCAGFAEQDPEIEGHKYIAHYIVYPDGHFIVQRKNITMPAEKPLTSAHSVGPDAVNDETLGAELELIEVKGVRCALTICADAGLLNLNERLAEMKIQVLLGPSGAGGNRDERVTDDEMKTQAGQELYVKVLKTVFFPGTGVDDCLKYRRALAAVNLGGYDGKRFHHLGHGMVISPAGEVPAFFHGIPNLDRQRPMYAHAIVDVDDHF